jgi:hypothetical protein
MNRRNVDRLLRENEVTYKGVLLIALSLNFAGLCLQQLLLEMNFRLHIFLPHLSSNLDAIALIGLLLSLISGWFAFKQIKMADAGNRDSRQHAIKEEIIREVNEGKEEVDKLCNKLESIVREIYLVKVELSTHMQSELHTGALTKFMNLEDKVYEIRAAIAILNKEAEHSLRLAKLEKTVADLKNNS